MLKLKQYKMWKLLLSHMNPIPLNFLNQNTSIHQPVHPKSFILLMNAHQVGQTHDLTQQPIIIGESVN